VWVACCHESACHAGVGCAVLVSMRSRFRFVRVIGSLAALWMVGGCAVVSSLQHLNVGAVSHLEVAQPPDALHTGERAPDFTLQDASGRELALRSQRTTGSRLVLVFYRGHWCPWCRRQLTELSGELAAFTSRGAAIVGVNVDAREDTQRFARDYHIQFPLLVDSQGEVSRRYVGREPDGTAIPGVYRWTATAASWSVASATAPVIASSRRSSSRCSMHTPLRAATQPPPCVGASPRCSAFS